MIKFQPFVVGAEISKRNRRGSDFKDASFFKAAVKVRELFKQEISAAPVTEGQEKKGVIGEKGER